MNSTMMNMITACLFVGAALVIPAAAASDQPLPAAELKLLETFVKEFVEITPGRGMFPQSFHMGSPDGPATERPRHEVRLEYSFSISRYEVPQNLYQAVMGDNPSRWKGPRNSAEMMTWREATEFCRKITARLREEKLIGADELIRLPSEAEWEYCCRAGTETAYSFGDEAQETGDKENQASILNQYAWHAGNAAGNDPPVGALRPNPWGLYDVHGYLWEFVADAWHEDYRGAPNDGRPRERTDGGPEQVRVVRGGSWRDRFDLLRSASRRSIAETDRSDAVGFRCVKARAAGAE